MNKNEKIGQLRERVTLQSVTETQSSTGYPAESWMAHGTRWAGVDYTQVGAKEDEQAGQKTAHTRAIFKLRYDKAVTQKYRLLHRNNYWDIITILPDMHREFMDLICELRDDYNLPA